MDSNKAIQPAVCMPAVCNSNTNIRSSPPQPCKLFPLSDSFSSLLNDTDASAPTVTGSKFHIPTTDTPQVFYHFRSFTSIFYDLFVILLLPSGNNFTPPTRTIPFIIANTSIRFPHNILLYPTPQDNTYSFLILFMY